MLCIKVQWNALTDRKDAGLNKLQSTELLTRLLQHLNYSIIRESTSSHGTAFQNPNTTKSVVKTSLCSAATYADSVALPSHPHSPAARRAAVCRAAIDPYLLPAGPQQQSLLTDGRTDRQTPDRCIDPIPHSMRAVPCIVPGRRWPAA